MLYDEEYTIEGARKRLEQEMSGEVEAPPPMDDLQEEASVDEVAPPSEETSRPPLIAMAESSSGSSLDRSAVARERYDDALEEIAHLRLKVQEIESSARKAEARAEKAEVNADRYRDRAHQALTRLEKLLESLS